MNVQTLLDELRRRGVWFATGGGLLVDAPAGLITDELYKALVRHKRELLKLLQRERRKREEAYRRRLVIQLTREHGWIALHDPTPTNGTRSELRNVCSLSSRQLTPHGGVGGCSEPSLPYSHTSFVAQEETTPWT